MYGEVEQMLRERKRLTERVRELEAKFRDSAGSEPMLPPALDALRQAIESLDLAGQCIQQSLEQLATEQTQRQRERRRYHNLFELCPDAYLVTGLDGTIREANNAATALFGRPAEALVGTALATLVSADQRDAFTDRLARLGETRDDPEDAAHTWDLSFSAESGRGIEGSITCKVDHEDAQIRWIICDRTEQKQAEAAARRMEEQVRRREQLTMLGTLAAGLGHDVKNLLFPIRSRLDDMAKHDLPTRASEDVEALRHSVRYLQQLAANLQILVERPDTVPIRATTDLDAWWEHVQPLLETAIPGPVRLLADFEPHLPPIDIAPAPLTQAIINLVNNAGEAAGAAAGRGTVTVRARRAADERFIDVSVIDDGPGMRREVLEQATDPFFTTKTHGLSTGLGLPLVGSIVKAAEGRIHVESEPGRGVSVTLTLPVALEGGDFAGHPEGFRYAAVSLTDQRLAATICTLLNLWRLPAWRVAPNYPGNSTLWVTDPTVTEPGAVRQYLEEQNDRRVTCVGAPPTEPANPWSSLPVIWVEPRCSPSALRDTLTEVVHEILHAGRDKD